MASGSGANRYGSEGTPAVAEYYDRKAYWPKESLERREALLARLGRR